jgi:hypothetical protein
MFGCKVIVVFSFCKDFQSMERMMKDFSKLFGEEIRANGYNLTNFTDPLVA